MTFDTYITSQGNFIFLYSYCFVGREMYICCFPVSAARTSISHPVIWWSARGGIAWQIPTPGSRSNADPIALFLRQEGSLLMLTQQCHEGLFRVVFAWVNSASNGVGCGFLYIIRQQIVSLWTDYSRHILLRSYSSSQSLRGWFWVSRYFQLQCAFCNR